MKMNPSLRYRKCLTPSIEYLNLISLRPEEQEDLNDFIEEDTIEVQEAMIGQWIGIKAAEKAMKK